MNYDPYDPYRYDDHGVLKVHPALSVIIFWSAHHILMLLLAALSNSSEVFGSVSSYGSSWPFIVSDIPGLLVFYARLNRDPGAGKSIRTIWKHGIALLVTSILLATLATLNHYRNDILDTEQIGFWIIVINAITVAYLLLAPPVKQVFSEFPKPK